MKKLLLIILLTISYLSSQTGTETTQGDKMEWYRDAKLGVFIHWGIYSVKGIGESWSFFNDHISHKDYIAQKDGFKCENYNPKYWAKLIKNSGAKYSVITSKHHDGFALWDTKLGNLNAVEHSAVGRDLLTPFVDALRENNLKVGLYFSLPDWSYEDYTEHTRKIKRYKIEDDPERWERFLNYSQGQMKELADKYNPDLWWFDGDWEHNEKEWRVDKIKSIMYNKNPNSICNSRLNGKGDYETPELGVPIQRPNAKYWELCITMNDSWGYQPQDKNHKSPQQVIDLLVDCISKGGNLLIDIGPKSDGTIIPEQEEVLRELGKWTSKHEEAIYGSDRGIPYDYFYGPTTLSKDGETLYLFVRDTPKDGKIILKGIVNDIEDIYLVGSNKRLDHKLYSKVSWNSYPGVRYIDIDKEDIDKYYNVVAVKLKGKIKLYGGKSGAIESN
ncbi:MAG: alpha-L-fucosidase [Candidatus Cloacimonadota bacterium]|nr:MAG: alpha-L-fucosidase [Candidatus Cloacimonadota bacterium]PIE78077.1 MAG: alpha-L-fucosidase [Candidatus Delongbacteria bacterium]